MSVVVIGLNHRTTSLELFERLTIDEANLSKVLHGLSNRDDLGEVVVLSTCNRIEVYATFERFHDAYRDIGEALAQPADLAASDLADHLYVHYDREAVGHLFSVAAGLDSTVLGESEILHQVRTAWERAAGEGTIGPTLNLLFRHAIETGKRARTETDIARGTASVSAAAVDLAQARLGTLAGRAMVLMGAGTMAEGMASSLQRAGVTDISVHNRTASRARDLAERFGGRSLRRGELPAALVGADVLLTSTGSPGTVIGRDDLESVMAARGGRPLLIVDIAVPRDVDPSAADLNGVTLLDITDVRDFAQAGVDRRRGQAVAVREIIDDEVERYRGAASARIAAPLVTSIHRWADDVRAGELERFGARLGDLDDAQAEAVEALTRALVNKLLHGTTVTLKDAAGTPRGERLAEAIRQIYDLDV